MRPMLMLLSLASFAIAGGACSDSSRPLDTAKGARLDATDAETELLTALDEGKLVRARGQAETILKTDPESWFALWAMARVYRSSDGNAARAMGLLNRARARIEAAHPDPKTGTLAHRWHQTVLEERIWLLGRMDRTADQLEAIDTFKERYGGRLDRLKLWPLAKQGRMEEAKALGLRLSADDDWRVRAGAYNGLLTVADEELDREAALRIGLDGISGTQERSCILYFNTAHSALVNLDFGMAESLARRAMAIDEGKSDCGASPELKLVPLFLISGAFQKTISVVKNLQKMAMDPDHRDQYQTAMLQPRIRLFYALGRFDAAERLAEQAFASPDRTGTSSLAPEEHLLNYGLTLWMVLDAQIHRLDEQIATRPVTATASLRLDRAEAIVRRAQVRRALIRIASDADILRAALRPYLRELFPWYQGALIPILGRGVMSAISAGARSDDAAIHDDASVKFSGYYDAFDGESAWRAGDFEAAERLGDTALKNLPVEAKLLRWRVHAWRADAAMARSDQKGAVTHFTEVLRNYPTVLRHLDIAVPAQITTDPSPRTTRAAELLAGSPRLRPNHVNMGFTLHISESDGELRFCLRDASGMEFGCSQGVDEGPSADESDASDGDAKADGALDDDGRIALALDRFHDIVFAPKVALTQQDLNSLDGAPVRVDAERALRGLLTEPAAEAP